MLSTSIETISHELQIQNQFSKIGDQEAPEILSGQPSEQWGYEHASAQLEYFTWALGIRSRPSNMFTSIFPTENFLASHYFSYPQL